MVLSVWKQETDPVLYLCKLSTCFCEAQVCCLYLDNYLEQWKENIAKQCKAQYSEIILFKMLAKFTYRLNSKFTKCDFPSFWWLNATIFYLFFLVQNILISSCDEGREGPIFGKLNLRWQQKHVFMSERDWSPGMRATGK